MTQLPPVADTPILLASPAVADADLKMAYCAYRCNNTATLNGSPNGPSTHHGAASGILARAIRADARICPLSGCVDALRPAAAEGNSTLSAQLGRRGLRSPIGVSALLNDL
jgi:hypothetical protein